MESGLTFALASVLGLTYFFVSNGRMAWRVFVVVVVVGLAAVSSPRPASAQETTTTTTEATTTTTTEPPHPLSGLTAGECAQLSAMAASATADGEAPWAYMSPEQFDQYILILSQPGDDPSNTCGMMLVLAQVGNSLAILMEQDREHHDELVAAIEAIESPAPAEAVSEELQNAVVAALTLFAFVGGSMWVRGFARG